MSNGGDQRRAAIVLGGSGRLGPHVVRALARDLEEIIVAARQASTSVRLSDVDVSDSCWWDPATWGEALQLIGVAGCDVAAVVNLVACRSRDRRQSTAVGKGSVRALVAASRVARPAAVTVHVASVAELRPGARTPYALGKAAARAEAQRLSVDVVLTVGVVPRPPGSKADSLQRRVATAIPQIRALPIAVSAPDEVGLAVAWLVRTSPAITGAGPDPLHVVLAGRVAQLGDLVGAGRSWHRWSHGALVALAGLPAVTRPNLARVISQARIATGRATNHYLATASPVEPGDDWSLVGDPPSELTLVPPTGRAS